MKRITYILFLLTLFAFAQEEESKKALKASKNLTWEANKQLSEDKFADAEADYRKAISKSTENIAAPYNLGNAYYQKESYNEAFGRFKQAGELAEDKTAKHKAYHNMGNVFMKNKEYQKAVEAYKEALRNNPKDEETRYNLALAKEMLKKEQEEQKNDQNKDNKDNQDNQDKDQNKDKKDEGDNKEDNKGDQKQDENKDQGDKGDKGDQQKEDNKKADGDEKKEQKKNPGQGDQQEQKQPRPNQLSKQQIQNLLRAMQNNEKKVQEKINAQKVKGVKVKNEKDW
ncbi:tetratricopeptide repeat protein [Costertonia aggregata]|uniref:Tetratricopeptide repeat protein n=1 Tax=Costertonia aggregata TaxID=343403 RepID=A0A7H9AQ06_9FLAO|nr:tetratricopeptide repeat protein [Costertonia aggregata]QLG45504.1 tetratricopeptide repeat protein [Costertonia aggregata]